MVLRILEALRCAPMRMRHSKVVPNQAIRPDLHNSRENRPPLETQPAEQLPVHATIEQAAIQPVRRMTTPTGDARHELAWALCVAALPVVAAALASHAVNPAKSFSASMVLYALSAFSATMLAYRVKAKIVNSGSTALLFLASAIQLFEAALLSQQSDRLDAFYLAFGVASMVPTVYGTLTTTGMLRWQN